MENRSLVESNLDGLIGARNSFLLALKDCTDIIPKDSLARMKGVLLTIDSVIGSIGKRCESDGHKPEMER